jgi:hypothetical protein
MRSTPALTLSALTLCASAALAGCGDNQDPAGADELWARIHAEGYESWTRAPGYATKQPAHSPHGDEVIIFLNDTIAAALAQQTPLEAWPEGSLIVKDGYSGAEVSVVAAMEKRKSGWYWAEWSSEGNASYSGEPDICTSCHQSGSDLVRAFSLPK